MFYYFEVYNDIWCDFNIVLVICLFVFIPINYPTKFYNFFRYSNISLYLFQKIKKNYPFITWMLLEVTLVLESILIFGSNLRWLRTYLGVNEFISQSKISGSLNKDGQTSLRCRNHISNFKAQVPKPHPQLPLFLIIGLIRLNIYFKDYINNFENWSIFQLLSSFTI